MSAESSGSHGQPGRWSRSMRLAFCLALLLAATQVLIWVKAVEARGGLESYVRGIDLMPTIAGGLAIRDVQGRELYDFDSQLAAQRQARAPYLTLEDGQLLPYIHPPFEALAIVPFLELPYAFLYGVLELLAFASIAASCWLLAGAVPLSTSARWLFIAAACSFHPLYQAFWLGQTSPFVLLGFCGTYVALRRQRVYLAALPLLLVALKPQVFLVLILLVLLLGHWRTVAIVTCLIAGSCIAAMPVLGLLWPLRYLEFLSAIAGWDRAYAVYPASMPTIRGLMVNLLGHISPTLATLCTSLVSLLLLGLLLWSWWRIRDNTYRTPTSARAGVSPHDLLWALTSIVAVLVPAHMGPHDHTLLLFPAWLLGAYAASGVWGRRSSAFWFTVLWGVYGVTLLIPFVTEQPAIAVVPIVLLLLTSTGKLVWQIATIPKVSAPNLSDHNTRMALPSQLVP